MILYNCSKGTNTNTSTGGNEHEKYEVQATVWGRKEGKQIKVVVGSFDKITNAIIFRDAYNKTYRSNAEIVEKQA